MVATPALVIVMLQEELLDSVVSVFSWLAEEDAVKTAKRTLSGSRLSDGSNQLQGKGQLGLSLEALVIDKRFTQLFNDEEANNALMRLLDAGYRF